jgi:phosphoribosylaminoimidazole carboxylase PurE protein
MSQDILVGLVMGSDSDLPVMREAAKTLSSFGVPFEITVASAHRSPERASQYATTAVERGLKVIICGAGWAAHLAGVIAAGTHLPVIGVPISSSPLNGLDALLATVQMPPGVPVATVGLDAAKNAALLAIQILALSDPQLAKKLVFYKDKLAKNVEEKAKNLQI